MPTVVVSAYNVVSSPDLGGHFWVPLQYVHGLRQAGCEVYWLERLPKDNELPSGALSKFLDRTARHGLAERVLLYCEEAGRLAWAGPRADDAAAVLRSADLLLNFDYQMSADLLSRFRRTALVDIDPGLLQLWMSSGKLAVSRHDLYFTTGETVGTPAARFPDGGLPWIRISPPVCLEHWPHRFNPSSETFSTVSTWWGGEFMDDGAGGWYDNNKRSAFLEFLDLPQRTSQPLELALYLSDADAKDRENLLAHGWRIRHSVEVAASPGAYREYIQASRGEFSCAKPSCIRLQNAWVSDRSLCYLASGKPIVVQHTGESARLPSGLGAFRFTTVEEAAAALATINADYSRQCRAAREIAESFDAKQTALEILENALP